MIKLILLCLIIFSNNIFAGSGSHPERNEHHIEYFYDLDKNMYMETYEFWNISLKF